MKYEFTNETKQFQFKTLHRIRRIADGKLGGWIEKEDNLSQYGNCWVDDEAIVCDNARVTENAQIYNKARILNNAIVSGNAKVYESAYICNNAQISDHAEIHGRSEIYGYAVIKENVKIYDNVEIWNRVKIHNNAEIYGNAIIRDNAEIYGNAIICDNVKIRNNVKIYEDAKVFGNAVISNNVEICGNAKININIYEGKFTTTVHKISYLDRPKYSINIKIKIQEKSYKLDAYDGVNTIYAKSGWHKINSTYSKIQFDNIIIHNIYEFDITNKKDNLNDDSFGISNEDDIRSNCYYIGISSNLKLDYLYYAVKKSDLHKILKDNIQKPLIVDKSIKSREKCNTLTILQDNNNLSNLYSLLEVSSFNIVHNKLFRFGYKQFALECIEIIKHENSKYYIGNCYDPMNNEHNSYDKLVSMIIKNDEDVKIFFKISLLTLNDIIKTNKKYLDIINDLTKLYNIVEKY